MLRVGRAHPQWGGEVVEIRGPYFALHRDDQLWVGKTGEDWLLTAADLNEAQTMIGLLRKGRGHLTREYEGQLPGAISGL